LYISVIKVRFVIKNKRELLYRDELKKKTCSKYRHIYWKLVWLLIFNYFSPNYQCVMVSFFLSAYDFLICLSNLEFFSPLTSLSLSFEKQCFSLTYIFFNFRRLFAFICFKIGFRLSENLILLHSQLGLYVKRTIFVLVIHFMSEW
jgi:hypothetical protein